MSTDELRQVADEYVAVAAAAEALRLRRRRAARRARLPDHADPVAMVEPAHRPLRRLAGEPHSLRARGRARRSGRPAAPEFVIGLKMPGDEGVAGGIDPDEAARITAALGGRRTARLFRLQPGQLHAQPGEPRAGHAFPARTFPRHPQEARPAAAGMPVMAIGRIATPAEAEAAIADGAGDLVGLTRALIADADWPAQGARRPRRRHPPIELRQFRLGRDPRRQAARRDPQPAARPEGRVRLASAARTRPAPRRRGRRRPGRTAGGAHRGRARTRT